MLSLYALHLCYISLIPLVVCSGLDGTCYSNNTVIDIGINFKSINNVCHTIYLTVRVKRSSLIDLIIGRVSLNKYSFYKLTPFAFGISEEHKVTQVERREGEGKVRGFFIRCISFMKEILFMKENPLVTFE